MATPETVFCSQVSSEQAEPLYGTATRADVWLMLEFGGRWGARAFAESELPPTVKAHLSAAVDSAPHTRLQFIKQPERTGGGGPVHFFAALANRAEPRLYAFTFDTLDDLLMLDVAAVVRGEPQFDAYLQAEPLFLVCTNGLRDRCCAKFGLQVYPALRDAAGHNAWQTTHIGGHRFAPNLLFMPHAFSYGHVDPEDVGEMVRAYRRGEVALSNLRGRTIHEKPAQAALHFLRTATGERSVDAYPYVHAVAVDDDGLWDVEVASAGSGDPSTVRVQEVVTDHAVYKTCGAEGLIVPTSFELASIT